MRTVHIETQFTDTFVTPNMTSVTQKLFCSRFMTERPEKGSHVKKHIGNYSFFFIPIKRELKLGYGLVPTRTVLI